MNTVLTAPEAPPTSSVDVLHLLPTSLLSPVQHASLILPEGRKGIAVFGDQRLVVDEDGCEDWRWHSWGANASELAMTVATQCPRFITLNAFSERPRKGFHNYRTHPNKRVSNLSSFGAVWVDIDQYKKPRWAHATESSIIWEIHDRLSRAGVTAFGIPLPSYIVRSGRGYHLVWLLEAVPVKARKAWAALQQLLNDLFVDMGRDTAVLPPSANLRLVGTMNEGEPVRIVWPETVGEIRRHSFRNVCRAAFPYTPEQVATYKVEKAAAKVAKEAARAAFKAERVRSGQPPLLTGTSYYSTLQRDLEKLCRGRWPERVLKGERNMWLLALSKVWAWSMPASALRQRIAEWAPYLGLSVSTALSQAGTVIRRAEAQDRSDVPLGKRGRYLVGPRKLAVEFSVTVTEARRFDLRMMIPVSMKRDRAAERQVKSRRARGVQALNEIQDARLATGKKALALIAQGLARAAVMKHLGVKKSYLDKALFEARAVASTSIAATPKPVAPVDMSEPSRNVSRYIASKADRGSELEPCVPPAYPQPVHDVAAPLTDPQPATP